MSTWDKFPVFLVEDNDDDLFFFRRLLSKAGLRPPLAVATDGQQAIEHMKKVLDGAPDAPMPKVMFLDLKLPLRGGFEVLQWVRSQPALADVVVVVLSSSAEARDVEQAHALGAQGYLVKYPEPQVFQSLLQQVMALPPGRPLGALSLPGLKRPG